jgi:hypothetical protein
VKLVKGEGRATRARARSARRVVCETVTRIHYFCHSCHRDRDAYALFLSFMSIIISCIKTTVTGN